MLVKLLFLFATIGFAISVPFSRSYKYGEQEKTISLEDVLSNKFYLKGFNGTWISNTDLMYRNEDGDLVKDDVHFGNVEIIVSNEILSEWNPNNIQMNSKNNKILMRYNVTTVFRHSILAQYTVLDLETQQSFDITEDKLWLCIWSPKGNAVAYVGQDNNVYYYNFDDQKTTQLTTDGVPGVVYNGIADWVYEEEVFGSVNGLWFSPNGTYLAMVHLNDNEVEKFTYHLYGEPGKVKDQYPSDITIRYPKSGTINPDVELRYVNVEVPSSNHNVLQKPDGYTILGSVNWVNDQLVAPFWLNRRQNRAQLSLCNVLSGSICTNRYTMDEPSGWIDNQVFNCYTNKNDQDVCYFIQNDSGWYRVHQLNMITGESIRLSDLNTTALQFIGQHPDKDELFFIATGKDDSVINPATRHLYRHIISTGTQKCLSCDIKSMENETCNYVENVKFSKDFSHFAVVCSGPGPSYTKIFMNGIVMQEVTVWETNEATRELLKEHIATQVQYVRVPVDGGSYSAMVKLYMPGCYCKNPHKKYPMIVDVYGGPNSVTVSTSFRIKYGDYLAQTQNIIYCQIDGRGSGNKGTDMLYSVNNRLGSFEIEDQIEVVKYLTREFDIIDPDRIGIWGWSYGGYATGMVLAKDFENVFRGGISVAPVSSWIYYDSIYTERYMDVPENNSIGYNAGDLTQLGKNMKDHKFLLIHGNADDNVHYQQAMQLARQLELDDVLFYQESYPDEAHGLNGVSRHLYHTMDEFWRTTLQLTPKDRECF